MANPGINIAANVTLNPQSVNAAARQMQLALGRITGSASEFQKSLDASTARVFAFGATTTIINGIVQSFKALAASTINVEKRLIEIQSILGDSETSFNQFRETIFSVAQNTGQAFDTVADAAAELARQGLSAEETAKRLEAALVLTRISGLDSVKSVKALTAAINGFTSAGLSASQITNKLVAVDTAFAVSAQDLAEAFSRAGSTAEDAGVSFDELLGIITAVEQTTARGGAVIGNALKSIFTRLGRGDTINELQALGVAIDESQNGIQKLQALSDALQKTSDPVIANQIKELAGGVYQINIVSAALKDLGKETSIFSQAAKTSGSAMNEAYDKNAKLNESISAQINTLIVGLTNLAEKIGQLTFAPLLKNLISLTTSFSEYLNKALDPEVGNKFIQGLFKTIGAFLAGPGLIIFTMGFAKIFGMVVKFAREGFKSIMEIGTQTEKIKQIEGGLVQLLSRDEQLRRTIASTTATQAQKEQAVIQAIQRENQLLVQQEALLRSISQAAMSRGIGGYDPSRGFTGKGGKRFASGYMPNVSPQDAMMESVGAKQHGYTAGKIKSGRIYDGMGSSFVGIWNGAEKRTDFINGAGKKATMIEPPNGFARGFIPNFAKGAFQIKTIKKGYLRETIGIDPATGAVYNKAQMAQRTNPANTEYKAYKQKQEALLARRKQRGKEISKEQKDLRTFTYEELSNRMEAPTMILPFTQPDRPTSDQLKLRYQEDTGFIRFNKLGVFGTDTGSVDSVSKELSNRFNEEKVQQAAFDEAKSFASQIYKALNLSGKPSGLSEVKTAGFTGAINSAMGALFDAAVSQALNLSSVNTSESGNFDIRNPQGYQTKALRSLFGQGSINSTSLADFKATNSESTRESMMKKIVKEYGLQGKFNAKMEALDKAQGEGTISSKRRKASGYIPNFTSMNKGVPVSQIRAHFDSMGNPIAVTNTRDEPNGLKDAIGREKKGIGMYSQGFVPNYAVGAVANAGKLAGKLAPTISKLGVFGKKAQNTSKALDRMSKGANKTAKETTMASGTIKAFGAMAIMQATQDLTTAKETDSEATKFAKSMGEYAAMGSTFGVVGAAGGAAAGAVMYDVNLAMETAALNKENARKQEEVAQLEQSTFAAMDKQQELFKNFGYDSKKMGGANKVYKSLSEAGVDKGLLEQVKTTRKAAMSAQSEPDRQRLLKQFDELLNKALKQAGPEDKAARERKKINTEEIKQARDTAKKKAVEVAKAQERVSIMQGLEVSRFAPMGEQTKGLLSSQETILKTKEAQTAFQGLFSSVGAQKGLDLSKKSTYVDTAKGYELTMGEVIKSGRLQKDIGTTFATQGPEAAAKQLDQFLTKDDQGNLTQAAQEFKKSVLESAANFQSATVSSYTQLTNDITTLSDKIKETQKTIDATNKALKQNSVEIANSIGGKLQEKYETGPVDVVGLTQKLMQVEEMRKSGDVAGAAEALANLTPEMEGAKQLLGKDRYAEMMNRAGITSEKSAQMDRAATLQMSQQSVADVFGGTMPQHIQEAFTKAMNSASQDDYAKNMKNVSGLVGQEVRRRNPYGENAELEQKGQAAMTALQVLRGPQEGMFEERRGLIKTRGEAEIQKREDEIALEEKKGQQAKMKEDMPEMETVMTEIDTFAKALKDASSNVESFVKFTDSFSNLDSTTTEAMNKLVKEIQAIRNKLPKD
jgi:TP901 family phage tail tape measure protein